MSEGIVNLPISVHVLLAVVFVFLYFLTAGARISLLFSGLAGFFVGIILARTFIALTTC